MGRIPEQSIIEIRDRVDIVDFVGRYIELKRAGRNFVGLCPFHNEKSPSFNVSTDRQAFHCFGCQEGGDVIGFLMRHESLAFPEAVRTLARECGVEIPEESGVERGVVDSLLTANERAQEHFRASLRSPKGEIARAYLERRGMTLEDADRFGIGFAPDSWDSLCGALRSAGIDGAIGAKAGLLAERDSGGHYDRMRGRLIFPISDARGRVIGFGGRALLEGQEPKYLNTPETPLFRKREALYGFPDALDSIRRSGRTILCEGYFDRIALSRAELGEGLATCGTALTVEHARQLRRRQREVVLLFDGDSAGRAAMERSLAVLLPEGLRVKSAWLPDGQDPDDLLAESGPAALQELVATAGDAIEGVLRAALREGVASPSEKSDLVARIAVLVASIPEPVERAEYVRRLAVATDCSPRAVEAVVRSVAKGGDAARRAREELESAPPRRAPHATEERHLQTLVAVVLRDPALADEVQRDRFESLLPEGSWKSILRLLCRAELPEPGAEFDLFALEQQLDEEAQIRLREVAFRGETFAAESKPEEVLAHVLGWFEKRRRDVASHRLTARLRDSSNDAMALLVEKQRQLEEKRAARRSSPGTVA